MEEQTFEDELGALLAKYAYQQTGYLIAVLERTLEALEEQQEEEES